LLCCYAGEQKSASKKAKAAAPKKPQASGVAVGLNKGYIVTRRNAADRPSRRRGTLSQRVKIIRSVVREVVGWAPYEKRIMEILRGGGANPQKRAHKFAKKRLGTHGRAKKKVVELTDVIGQAAKAAAQAAASKKAAKEAKAAAKA